jgi:oligopeptidase B
VSPESPGPPVAERIPHARTYHGDTVIDDYAWMADTSDPAALDYLHAQNDFTAAATAHLQPLRERIFAEIKAHTQETDLSVPTRRGDWWYFARTAEGSQYTRQCRVPVTDPADWTPPAVEPGVELPGEQVILDSNEESQGHEFFSLGAAAVSPDGTRLAYSVDVTGDERFDLRIRDLATGAQVGPVIPDVFYGATFSPDGEYLFYTRVDSAWRPDTVFRHHVGGPTDARNGGGEPDVPVFHEPDERFWVHVGRTRSDRYLVIESGSKLTSETLVCDGGDPTGEFAVLLPRREGVEYSVEHAVLDGRDSFLILHNATGPNFELASVPVADVRDPSAWTVQVPHRDDVRLDDVDAFAGTVGLGYRRGGLPRLALAPSTSVLEFTEWEAGEPLVDVALAENPEWSAPRLRLAYESYLTPTTVLELDLASGATEVVKRAPVPGYDAADYTAEQLWVTARDGARVPVSLVRRRDTADGGPALLYGYGSYETCLDPGFSVSRLSLMDRGVSFVIAHVRGGGEMGRLWYDDGKQLNKQHTFDDFVDVARWLRTSGRASALVAMGASAGGLLVGAALNQAPELFAGVLAVVPFVDPLTSILDPELPLTVTEWDEWGNPLADPEVYRYLKGYSPYENIADLPYPAVLATTSLNDTRVLPTEPAKWIAKLAEHTTSGEPLLLKTEMVAGHGGPSGRYGKWREVAFEYAWVLDRLGVV